MIELILTVWLKSHMIAVFPLRPRFGAEDVCHDEGKKLARQIVKRTPGMKYRVEFECEKANSVSS
jgi:hypothetical protein